MTSIQQQAAVQRWAKTPSEDRRRLTAAARATAAERRRRAAELLAALEAGEVALVAGGAK